MSPNNAASEGAFHDVLKSVIASGASYAALMHQNGVSIAALATSVSAPHKRDELAILATALIAAAQALARSLEVKSNGTIRQHFDAGGLILQPITTEHWLFLVASDTPAMLQAEANLPLCVPVFQALLAADPSVAAARFMDDIEFADLSDLRFD